MKSAYIGNSYFLISMGHLVFGKNKFKGLENIDKSDDNVTGYANFTTGCLAIEVHLVSYASLLRYTRYVFPADAMRSGRGSV